MEATAELEKQSNILLVDDLPQNLVVLEAVLKSPDYTLIKASSGNEALELVRHKEFAVIILDVNMPGLDGYETARQIKEMEKGREVPIIFVTATYRDDPHIRKGYEAGAVDYFGKPFDPEILKTKVNIYSNLYQRTHRLREREIELIQTQELLKGEKKLKTILETLSEGVVVADKNGRITQMNEEARRIWGDSRFIGIEQFDQYLGWWLDSGQKLESHEWAMSKAFLEGETTKSEKIKILSFDGKEKVIINSASPLWEENGEIAGAVAVIEDITYHQNVQSELEQKARELNHNKHGIRQLKETH